MEIEVLSPITVTSSEQYTVIIADAKDVRHFFLEKEGELSYDGYCVNQRDEPNCHVTEDT